MRITILTNRDIHSNVAVNLLLPLLSEHNLTIFLSEKVGRPKPGYRPPDGLRQLSCLEQLFLQVISPLVESQSLSDNRFLTFHELGKRVGTPIRVLANINSKDGFRTYADSRPDLVLSIRYGSILREPAIAVPRFGVLNLHSGLLPRYQGILTTLHSLIEDQTEVGCTLHFIDSPKIDAGPIVNAARVPVSATRSLLWHVLQLYPKGCQLIGDAVRALEETGELQGTPQGVSQQRYYTLPEEEHFAALRAKGFQVWDCSEVVHLFARYLPRYEREAD